MIAIIEANIFISYRILGAGYPKFKWMDKFHENMHLTIIKGRHIIENLKEKRIDLKFLKGVEKFVPIIIQTEYLFLCNGIFQFNIFEKFQKEFKQHLGRRNNRRFSEKTIKSGKKIYELIL